ncbi:hypothetical protein JK358_38865, partial [Nocardia sp. 2]
VGVDDSFFDLGGNSLSAMRVIAAIRHSMNLDIEVRLIFQNPTIAGLAGSMQTDAHHRRRLALVAAERPDMVPLSFA